MRHGMNGFGGHACQGPMGCRAGRGGLGRWGQRGGGLRTGQGQCSGLGRGWGAISPNDTEAERRHLELRAEWLKRDLESVQKRVGELSDPEANKG